MKYNGVDYFHSHKKTIEYHLAPKQKENCQYDHIPIALQENLK